MALSNRQTFFFDGQTGGERLFAVAQRGIKYDDPIRHGNSLLNCAVYIRASDCGNKKPVLDARVWCNWCCHFSANTNPRGIPRLGIAVVGPG